MKWTLVGSAVSHLSLFLFLFLLMGDAVGPGNPVPVHVVLVEGERERISLNRKVGPENDAAADRKHEYHFEQPQVSDMPQPPAAAPLLLPGRISIPDSSASKMHEEKPAGAADGRSADADPGEARSIARSDDMGSGGKEASPDSRFHAPGRGISGIDRRFAAGGPAGEGQETRRLREKIEALITYPEDAVRRGKEGEVLLRIRVGEGGIPREVRIARSSGTAALDEAARTGVSRASPLPSRPGWFEVPVRFHLR